MIQVGLASSLRNHLRRFVRNAAVKLRDMSGNLVDRVDHQQSSLFVAVHIVALASGGGEIKCRRQLLCTQHMDEEKYLLCLRYTS